MTSLVRGGVRADSNCQTVLALHDDVQAERATPVDLRVQFPPIDDVSLHATLLSTSHQVRPLFTWVDENQKQDVIMRFTARGVDKLHG